MKNENKFYWSMAPHIQFSFMGSHNYSLFSSWQRDPTSGIVSRMQIQEDSVEEVDRTPELMGETPKVQWPLSRKGME